MIFQQAETVVSWKEHHIVWNNIILKLDVYFPILIYKLQYEEVMLKGKRLRLSRGASYVKIFFI